MTFKKLLYSTNHHALLALFPTPHTTLVRAFQTCGQRMAIPALHPHQSSVDHQLRSGPRMRARALVRLEPLSPTTCGVGLLCLRSNELVNERERKKQTGGDDAMTRRHSACHTRLCFVRSARLGGRHPGHRQTCINAHSLVLFHIRRVDYDLKLKTATNSPNQTKPHVTSEFTDLLRPFVPFLHPLIPTIETVKPSHPIALAAREQQPRP